MLKVEAEEAAAIVERMLDALSSTASARGRAGSNLRTTIGELRAEAVASLQDGSIGVRLGECFESARLAGATLGKMARVREGILAETPANLPAALVMEAGIGLCLVIESRILVRTRFTSRQDVDAIKVLMNDAFNVAEESAADIMDAARYRAVVQLHAAVIFHLTETARPLPRMVRFNFAAPMPTLLLAQRLYYDGGRADELKNENKTVHPAFAQRKGRALSA